MKFIQQNNLSPNLSSSTSYPTTVHGALTPLAAEFVPGGVKSTLNVGMNTAAAAWMPDEINASTSNHLQLMGDEFTEDQADMHEVNWNGSTFFVAGNENYPDEEEEEVGYEHPEFAGLDWAADTTTIAAPLKRSLQTIGIPEPIRQHFQSLDIESLRQMDPSDERYKEIPSKYFGAFLLDDSTMQRGAGGSFGYPSSHYKVVDRSDSQIYALKRFDNVRTTPSVVKNSMTRWAEMRHPSIVSLYSVTQVTACM